MKRLGGQVDSTNGGVRDLLGGAVLLPIERRAHAQPGRRGDAADQVDNDLRGSPAVGLASCWVMWQNMRCSILFHLLVPGGKWQTVQRQPELVGQVLQFATFHSRAR